MRVYSLNDRIDLEIDGLVFKISPLSYKQKMEIQGIMEKDPFEGSIMCLKFALKDVTGLEGADGKPYKLIFENNVLADSCVDDILNIENGLKLQLACTSFMSGIPSKIIHPTTGEEVKGVKVKSQRPLVRKRK